MIRALYGEHLIGTNIQKADFLIEGEKIGDIGNFYAVLRTESFFEKAKVFVGTFMEELSIVIRNNNIDQNYPSLTIDLFLGNTLFSYDFVT